MQNITYGLLVEGGTLSIATGKSSKYYFYKYFDYNNVFAVLCISQVQSCRDGIGDVA